LLLGVNRSQLAEVIYFCDQNPIPIFKVEA